MVDRKETRLLSGLARRREQEWLCTFVVLLAKDILSR